MQTMLLRSRSLLCTVLRLKEMLEALGEQRSEYFVLCNLKTMLFSLVMWLSSISSFCAYVTVMIGIQEIEKENEIRIVLIPYLA